MTQQHFGIDYTGNPAANYERFFVPAVGAPLAADLINRAGLREGERVLDVACGTGVVARLAAERVGGEGAVSATDVNPGMLAVARSATDAGADIDWREASAESMPYDDGSFDVVLCQMGLQFVPDKTGALKEMRRVLAPGGRLLLNAPGPMPAPFVSLEDALRRHLGPQAAGFVGVVFSLHDAEQIRSLAKDAGFSSVNVDAETKTLRLPPPDEFLWQYISSTPLSIALTQADDDRREAIEQDVLPDWRGHASADGMTMDVRVVTAEAGR